MVQIQPGPTCLYDDSSLKLYYLRAPYYDPSTAQFISRGPAVATTLEAYAYVRGNPLNWTDPSGLLAGGLGPDVDALGFDVWIQAVQDLYIRGRGQVQALQEARQQLIDDPQQIQAVSRSAHAYQYEQDMAAVQRTLSRLRGLRGGNEAACELESYSAAELDFAPATMLAKPAQQEPTNAAPSEPVEPGGSGSGEGFGLGSGGEPEFRQ